MIAEESHDTKLVFDGSRRRKAYLRKHKAIILAFDDRKLASRDSVQEPVKRTIAANVMFAIASTASTDAPGCSVSITP